MRVTARTDSNKPSISLDRTVALPKVHVKRFATALGFVTLLCILGAVWTDFHRGYWYDEGWTSYFAQHDVALADALSGRWMQDIHPPFYSFVVWIFQPLTGDQIANQRLINLLPLLIISLAFIAAFIKSEQHGRWFVAAFLLAILPMKDFQYFLSEARSYVFVLLGTASMIWFLYRIVSKQQDYERRDWRILTALSLSSFTSINLHYTNGIIGLTLLGGFTLLLAATKRRRWAWRLFALASICGLVSALLFYLQVPLLSQHRTWFDDVAPQKFIWNLPLLVFGAAKANIVVTLAAICGAWKLVTSPSRPAKFGYTSMLVLCAAVATSAFVVLNAFKPLASYRYAIALEPLYVSILASCAASLLERHSILRWSAVIYAAVMIPRHSFVSASQVNWFATAQIIKDEQRRCPGVNIYVAEPASILQKNRIYDWPNQAEVERYLYEQVAARFNFRVEPLASRRALSRCPTIIWREHMPSLAVSAVEVARKEGLVLSAEAAAGARTIKGSSGVVLYYPPLDGSQSVLKPSVR